MKRIVIVCFIMVGIIATGVGSLVHLIRVSDEMDQMLSEVAQAIDRDDLEEPVLQISFPAHGKKMKLS